MGALKLFMACYHLEVTAIHIAPFLLDYSNSVFKFVLAISRLIIFSYVLQDNKMLMIMTKNNKNLLK